MKWAGKINFDGRPQYDTDGLITNIEANTLSGSLQANIDEKSDTSHLHDDRYYTESEIDDLITTISGKLDDHNELNNLDYASSGHTGFQPSGEYLTDSEFSTYSGTLQSQIDDKSEVVSLLDLVDTPTTYSGSAGKYLKVSLNEHELEYAGVQGIATTTISGWDTSGSIYCADFNHNLNTDDISVFLVDTTTNKEVGAEDIEIVSVNTVRIYITDNTSSIKVNVITGGFGTGYESFSPTNTVYVAKNGSDSTPDGSRDNPFLTIGAANDYAITLLNPIVDWDEAVVIKVAPGKYLEHFTSSHRRIYIVGNTNDLENWRHDVIIYNTGADPAHYVFDLDIGLNLIGLTVQVNPGGIYGSLPNKTVCSICQFRKGYFTQDLTIMDFTAYFNYCVFSGDGFKFEGLSDAEIGIYFRKCDIYSGSNTIFSSSGTGAKKIKLEDTKIGNPITMSGEWSILGQGVEAYNNGLLTFDTDGYIDIYNSVIVNGIHFVSDTSGHKKFINNYFRDIIQEFDITADVDILDVEYNGNHQDKGLSGEIKIINPTKKVGYKIIDTYINIEEALKAASIGDIVEVYNGTYNENVVVPAGVNIYGISKKDTIITSVSGTAVTKNTSGTSYVKNLTVISTVSGTNNSHLIDATAGTVEFVDCNLEMSLVDTYAEAVLITNSDFILDNTSLTYTQTGDTSGEVTHRLVYLDGVSSLKWVGGSVSDMTINDSNSLSESTMCESCITSNVKITMNNSSSAFVSQNSLWDGDAYSMKIDGTLTEPVSCSELNISVVGAGGSGNGYAFYMNTVDNGGVIYGTLNTLTAEGFHKNYVGSISEGDTFNSHFDMLNAVDLITGSGTINYVNSPGAGNLMLSGSYINMYDNDLIVAKRGGEFTSIKAAMESITDNSSTNRYNIHVHSGFYTEDNPIELKPYVYISGAFKHNPRILPANPLEHLFIIPAGYCTCDFGEITLQAPEGDATHQVYMVYAGPGCKPITGFYNCLFLGAWYGAGDYCNGFYDEEVLSGYHTVNCMLYGEFNKFAHMNGGCWTDSGTLPEFTTTLNHYLYMTGEGTALIDLMRNTGSSFENLIYVNHADAEIALSDVYSLDQKTLITGPLGGYVKLRGSSLNGKMEIDAGDIVIHSGSFENNGYLEALTGNLNSLMITSTRNVNTVTHCIKVTGGGDTQIYLGGGNIFDSPDGIDPIKLDGTFSKVQVEGVSQYNLTCLASGTEHTFNHLPDLDYSRIAQIQAYPGVAGSDNIEYLTVDESNYIQEDNTKTVFTNNTVTLSGIGSIAYGHWHMNETSGQYAYDSSGNGRTGYGEHTDAADWIGGKLNNCLQFNNKDERIECGNIASWERTDVFTLECWVYTTNTQLQYVLSKMEDATGKGYGFYLDATNRPHFILRNSTGNELDVYWNSTLAINTWYHVVCTYDGTSTPGGCHIWVDNDDKTLVTLANTLSSSIINTIGFQMSGKEGRDNDELVGRIDEVVIYEQELTSTEVAYRYNSGTGIESLMGTYPITDGYYITTASGSNLDMSTWTNIGGMVFDETIESNTQIKYLLSVDGRSNWNYWGGGSWVSGTLSGIDTYGNSSNVLESLNDVDFNGLFTASSGTLDVAASLKTTSAYLAPVLNVVGVTYSTPGSRSILGDNSIRITYVDATHTKIENITDYPITGIRCNILKMQPY